MITIKRTSCVLLFSLFASCSQESYRNVQETSTQSNIADKQENKKIPPGISLVHVIGGMETDENYVFHKPTDIGMDSDRNRYIVDSGNRRIQKYDRNWNFITTVDRRFRIPKDIHVNKRDRMFIGDWGHKEIIILGKSGRRNRGRSKLTGSYNNVFQFLHEDVAVTGGLEVISQNNRPRENLILQFYDLYGRKVSGFGARTSRRRVRESRFFDMNWLHVARNKRYIFVAYNFRPGFQKFNRRGSLLHSSVSESDKEIEYTKNIVITPEIFSTAIALDKNNILWLASTKKNPLGNEYLLKLYDTTENVLISEIQMDHPVDKIRIFNDRIFFVDTRDTMAVYEYKLLDVE